MEELIKNLTPMNACLLGSGFDNRLEYLKHLIKLDILEFKSGEQFGTWTIPDEWIVRDAWVKFNGEKIIDYKKEPLSLVVGSLPFNGKVSKEELLNHLHWSEDALDSTPYVMQYYDKDWGFCVPKNQIRKDKECILEEGEYEVFIDTEWKPGIMKLGVHTIKGNSDREILLFAHLDHPFQANDNLSGVACLVDLVNKIKCEHTIKIIFCPETIGSIVYAYTQDLSKVDFVIAVDICGNDNSILIQKTWNLNDKLNYIAHCTLQIMGKTYRKAGFRATIGSDESVFNDPIIGIPGLMISRHPYKEYHTALDKPEIINYEMIKETGDLILKIIEIWEKDFIPVRKFKGQLMRSRYGIQSPSKQLNLNYDYFFYSMDGKRSLAELCANFELNFDTMYDTLKKIIEDKQISGFDFSQESIPTPYREEHS